MSLSYISPSRLAVPSTFCFSSLVGLGSRYIPQTIKLSVSHSSLLVLPAGSNKVILPSGDFLPPCHVRHNRRLSFCVALNATPCRPRRPALQRSSQVLLLLVSFQQTECTDSFRVSHCFWSLSPAIHSTLRPTIATLSPSSIGKAETTRKTKPNGRINSKQSPRRYIAMLQRTSRSRLRLPPYRT